MAKVVLIGLESTAARQLGSALGTEKHEIRQRPKNVSVEDLMEADIVFAGGERGEYLHLLHNVRAAKPNLPFVVVSRVPETSDWLDALEAGATDYCSAPFEKQQMRFLMETALPQSRTVATAA